MTDPAPRQASTTSPTRELHWSYLGRVAYSEALVLQERTRDAIKTGAGPESLLLLEHPPVYTLGRNASATDILATPDWLAERGIQVVETNRGGQVTFHGPGQLVGYPILDLNPDRRDIRRYVRDLQRVLVAVLADYGIRAEGGEEQAEIGVWADGGKVASIGVHLSRWITTHGFALNVTTDLGLFGGIVPCGLPQARMASIESLTGSRPPLAEVAERAATHLGAVFGRSLIAASPSVAVGVG